MKDKRISINISDLDRSSILRTMRIAYRLGYTTIELTNKNTEAANIRKKSEKVLVRDVIRDEVTHLIGVQLQSSDQHKNVLVVTSVEKTDTYEIIKRTIKRLIEMSEELTLLFKGHLYAASILNEKQLSAAKLASYGVRQINMEKQDAKSSLYYHILGIIDKTADFMMFIAAEYSSSQKTMSPTGVKLFQELHDCVVACETIYNKYTAANIVQFSLKRDDMKQHIRESVKNLDSRESYLIGKAAGVLELLAELMKSRMMLEQINR
jgi:hypothetical protein